MTETGQVIATDVRPVVGRKPDSRAVWIFAGALLIAAVLLFSALEARRSAIISPAIAPVPPLEGAMIASPPELAIPPDWEAMRSQGPLRLQIGPGHASETSGSQRRALLPPSGDAPSYVSPVPSSPFSQQINPPPVSQGPAYAYQAAEPLPPAGEASASANDKSRARASTFTHPSTTVPQGTVIQAVLETALNSSREGFAKAVVSRDVYSFDGTRVLIPRGSKLFGEYGADVGRGQNRALIQWRRLTRPDGVIIDVDSPSADTLGRAGIKGKVDTHFIERFGGAILQSVLDIAVQLAVNEAAGDTVIVALPNSAPTVAAPGSNDVKPTVKVRQGTSVSVFVARDLDFTDVER